MTLGPQFQRVYRGIEADTVGDIDLDRLGHHWTTDRRTAQSYATVGMESGQPRAGAVVEALVHNRNIVHRGTPEWEARGDELNYMPDWDQDEVPVIPGRPVHVQSVEMWDEHDRDVQPPASKFTRRVQEY
jgi:hypothetical protein